MGAVPCALGAVPCSLGVFGGCPLFPGGHLGAVPCALGVFRDCPLPSSPLAGHWHRCLTPGQQSLTGGATVIRITGKSAQCPRSPVALPAWLYPEPTGTRAQPHRSPALGMFCTESAAQTRELLARASSEQSGGRFWHSLGSSHPLCRAAVSQPARPLMLFTLLGDYLV